LREKATFILAFSPSASILFPQNCINVWLINEILSSE
jgi:hypothetical protein